MAARRESTGDRRASTRLSIQQDVDEDYDLEAMGVSDGFRPSDVEMSQNRISFTTSRHHEQVYGRRSPPPRPSSTTKPKLDSFTLRHDGATGSTIARNSTTASSSNAIPTRSSSVSTEMAFVRAESPYQGPVGPSHPYQMYPQESRLARTASIATTATVPVPERSYSGPNGPTHPYGMYHQNTVPEAGSSHSPNEIAPVPVGFHGLDDNYHRRLGPDGEEIADIIGPDGHTEQLPPYTQYPEEAFARKARMAGPIPLPGGAGGIGLATRNPEFASQEDLSSPQSRQSTRSLMSDSSHQINTAALGISEKPELKKWQKVARRKICGIIPVWAIVLVGTAFILFGVILGSVLAALRPKHPPTKHHVPDGDPPESIIYTATMTTTFDATPFATLPPGVPNLPTGTFALPISTPSVAPNSCLTNPSQSGAWSCAIAPILPYQMIISSISGSSNLSNNEVLLNLGNNTMEFLPYGAQPPILTQNQILRLEQDNDDLDRGPAWFFQTTYDKLVIVQENVLTVSNAKRDLGLRSSDTIPDFMRQGVAQVGDRPWFCYWNDTLLEAFIYVNETSSAGSRSSSPSSYPTGTSAGSYGRPQSATSTYASGVPTSDSLSLGFSGPAQVPVPPPCYPKVIKVEERRLPSGSQSPSPYCVQHYIAEDGLPQPLLNITTGQPFTISLNETESSVVSPMSDRRALFDSLQERDENLNERQSSTTCGCVWLAQ